MKKKRRKKKERQTTRRTLLLHSYLNPSSMERTLFLPLKCTAGRLYFLVKMWALLVFLLLNHARCLCSGVCPSKCVCDQKALSIQCFRAQAIPSGIHKETRRLNLAYNHLTELKGRDISGLTELEDIILSSCALEAIEASAFRTQEGLLHLDLQKNKLRLLPRGLPPSLETLNVSHNRVLALQEPAVDGLRNLRVLDLQNNLVTTLRANVLSGLVSLECLYLDGNRIETVQGALRLAQLNLLSVGSNRIQSFPSAFFAQSKSLVTLRLTNNSLSRVPNDLPGSLTFLNLDRNQIRSLRNRDMFQLKNLASLSLAQNRLSSVDGVLRLPNLTVLEVPGNRLRALPNRLSPRMERLDCRQNVLQEVTFQQVSAMRQLKHLFLENNTIKIFETNALRNNIHLTNLALEQNLLTSIPEGLPGSLIRLDMKGNHITSIQERELRSLRRLQVLNLRKNHLTSLPHGLPFLLPRLGTLFLDANPWNCTCELQKMKVTLVARGVELPNGEPCSEEEMIKSPPVGGWRAYILQQDSCEEDESNRDYTPIPEIDNEEYYDYDA